MDKKLKMDIKDIFYQYIDAINEHNVEKIYHLMADDYIFSDAWQAEIINGKIKSWQAYADQKKVFDILDKNK